MRISDWSSDVCSSDLAPRLHSRGGHSILQIAPHVLQFTEEARGLRTFCPRFRLPELLQQFLLAQRQASRGLHVDLHNHVAKATAVQNRHPSAALAAQFALLNHGWGAAFLMFPLQTPHRCTPTPTTPKNRA